MGQMTVSRVIDTIPGTRYFAVLARTARLPIPDYRYRSNLKYAGHTSENWWPITDSANVVQAVDKVATWHPCLFLSSSNIATAH